MTERPGGGEDSAGDGGATGAGAGPANRDGDNPGPSGRRRWLVHLYDVAASAGGVLLVGLLVLAVSGVWPPLVAIESGSMEPHIRQGDLVFVMNEQRFPGADAQPDTGIVTAHRGDKSGYRSFQGPGDVIVFQPGGDEDATPIIHRAMFWVDAGENWYDRAEGEHLGGADSCAGIDHCEAPHAGFVTKGDSNSAYDQVSAGGQWAPVKPAWIVGTAEYRVPVLGRLRLSAQSALGGAAATETGGSTGGANATIEPVAAGR